ncbi:MAG TPA: ATP-binding protein [Bryobacteraceae bacterium]|nr:ATP-binding protein [Bryobacteraceae bacterium]
MRLSSRDKIRIGFWVLPLVPLLLSVIAFRTVSDAFQLSREVLSDTGFLLRVERLHSDLKDVEVLQRQYILTGDNRFLRNLQPIQKRVTAEFESIRTDYPFTSPQRNYINSLELLIPQKFDEIRQTILLYQEGETERAKQIVTSERLPMDDIRLVVDRLVSDVNKRLASRREDVYKLSIRTIALFVIVLGVNVLFVWVLFQYMRRELHESKLEEERMRMLNAELEDRVAQRTEALRRSNEELQQFAYVASHDLQEPLRMVRSYMELLEKRYKDKLDDDAREFIGYAVDGTKRMSTLINGLLEYSKAGEASDRDLPMREVEPILKTVLDNLRVQIEEASADVQYGPMPKVRFDELRLAQIFQNLINNALKYRSDRPPCIRIEAAVEAERIVFSVKDNGMGIAKEHQEQIFGVFQRLHGREYEGTGIGLATVKKVVERHGGNIWLESTPGEGSTFYFSVPVYHEAAAGAV